MTVVFWAAAALIVYTYLGYPVVLWLRVRMFPRPALRESRLLQISIVMVVRNEEEVLQSKLRNLLSLEHPSIECEIVVVSDGSSDGTNDILREHADDPRFRTAINEANRGKASGLNDAIALASGDIVVFTDARQQLEPGAVRLLLENFADPEVGCVSGALMLGHAESGEAEQGLGLYWRIEKKIRELESACGSVVGATGAIYAVRRELLPIVPEGTILDDVYIPMQVVRRGKRVIFDPRARAWDSPDLGTEREFSRKVRTLFGNYQLVQLEPWLLSWKNPLLFEFISHKLLRLAVPFALAALLFASSVLAAPFYRFAFVLQVLFYGLSLLAILRIKRGPLARASDAALTFVLLNSAAAVAFAKFITRSKTVWAR